MHLKNFYSDLTEKEIYKKIKEEGFTPIKISDSPGYVYNEHSHPETKLLAILEGEMKVIVENEKTTLKKGDKLIIPGNTKHSAVIGKDGCIFFWSEKLI